MISVIITSFTDFGDYTTPLIASMRLMEEKPFELIVIDNGSKDPYPRGDYTLARFDNPISWSRMLNYGASLAAEDWLCFLNDDVRCFGRFVDIIEDMNKHGLYGSKLKTKPPTWQNMGIEIKYIPAWMLVIQKSLYNKIGGMDEWYPKAGVDDIDFCWRADQLGIPLVEVKFPFAHLAFEKRRRTKWFGFDKQMKKSIDYFRNKVNTK